MVRAHPGRSRRKTRSARRRGCAAAASFVPFAAALETASADSDKLPFIMEAWHHTTFFDYPENRDLYCFASEIQEHLSAETTLVSAAASLKAAVDDLVIYQRVTGIYQAVPVYGLSVLIPSHNEWPLYSANYGDLTLCQFATAWVPFIENFETYTASLPADRHRRLRRSGRR